MSRKNGTITKCEYCGVDVYEIPSRRAQGRGRFCSTKCMSNQYKNVTGSNHPAWKGENHRFIAKRNGNRHDDSPPLPWVRKENGKFQPEYRSIAEKILGRPLTRDEVVHHIDFNPLNNAPDNLLVCQRSEHKVIEGLTVRALCALFFDGVDNRKQLNELLATTDSHGKVVPFAKGV